MSTTLARTERLITEGMEAGLHFGAQVYVSRGAGANLSGHGDGETQADDSLVPDETAASSLPESWELALGERAEGLPMETSTLSLWLSATKPVTAVACGLLWQDGALDLDDPVARHIPEFAAKGKGGITIRHLLTHTAGIRMLNLGWPAASWEEIIAKLSGHRPEPRWTPGQKAGYHLASSWFVLGEVIARVAEVPFSQFVRERVLEPCGMDDSWIGMPEERFREYGDRLGHVWSTENGQTMARRWHVALSVVTASPGGNGWGPIRELGFFYEMLLRRGTTRSGARLLSPQTVEAMTTPQRVGLYDHTFRQKLDWGLGFITDSKHYGESLVAYGYGEHASRRTFGHSGFQSSTVFADPEHHLVVALLVNGQPGEPTHTRRMKALAEAVYEDLGLDEASERAP